MERILKNSKIPASPPIPPTADGNHCTYESVPAFQLHTPQIRNVWLAPDLSRPRFPFYDDGQPQPMVVEYEGSLRGEWLVPPSNDSDSCDSAADEPTSPGAVGGGGKQSGGGGKDPDGDSGVDVNLCGGSGDEQPMHYYSQHCQPGHHPTTHFTPTVYQVVPSDRQHRHHGW